MESALKLLGSTRLRKADQAYRDALKELIRGKPGDTMTDAATPFQATVAALGSHSPW